MLLLHRNNRMERLLEELGDVLSTPRGQVFRPELVVVQSLGMERWLSMGLSRRFGVWANAEHPFPRAFIESMFDAVLGPVADEHRWTRESLTFHLAGILRELPAEPSLSRLRSYLATLNDIESRLELARELADAFDQAQIYRPDWFLSWATQPTDLDADDFRPALFRRLVERLGALHFPARSLEFERQLAKLDAPRALLPTRVSLFAVAALPPAFLHVLDRLSDKIEVHWFLLTATREYVGEELAKREIAKLGAKLGASAGRDAAQPLLGSYGRMMRDLGLLLERDCNYADQSRLPFAEPDAVSVLSTLQADVCALRRRGEGSEAPRLPLPDQDQSIQIHSCHGPRRELEVLRELLLDAFERDPTLVPEDVIVLLRDVEVYAPLVDAVFASERHRPRGIPYTLADRAIGFANGAASALDFVLGLGSRRMSVADLAGLLEHEPVLLRMGIDSTEGVKIRSWLEELGASWGTDVAERGLEGLPAHPQHTLRFALSRLLLGAAMSEEFNAPFAGVTPYDVEGDDAELAGRLVDGAERLFRWRAMFLVPRSLADWATLLDELIESLFVVPAERSWELTELKQAVLGIANEARTAGFADAVPVRYVAKRLTEHFEHTRSARTFLSRGVTFCAMLPMRGVPARIVAMLGLDDGAFPRVARVSSFDAIARDPRVGDRLVREEDRHLFLESLLAARERLILTYTGRSPRDDSSRPPSVVIEELKAAIDETFFVPDGTVGSGVSKVRASDRLVIVHPMHAHSPRYFDGSEPRLVQRNALAYRSALALSRAPQVRAEPRLVRLSPLPCTESSLPEFERFWSAPGEYFVERRLLARFERDVEPVPTLDPTELDGLGRYDLMQWQFRALGNGTPIERVRDLWRGSGRSPIGSLGDVYFDRHLSEVRKLRAMFDVLAEGRVGRVAEVRIRARGCFLSGFVEDVFPRGRLDWGTSALSAKRRLSAWIRHLALGAVGHDVPTILIRPAPDPGKLPMIERIIAIGREESFLCLERLLELYEIGTTAPLPFFPEVSCVYAQRIAQGEPNEMALERALQKYGDPFDSSASDFGAPAVHPEVARWFGDEPPLAPDWPERRGLSGMPSFPELAEAVWGPCLRATVPMSRDELEAIHAATLALLARREGK
ncbi:MAG: exodeoxyribonuclease V subunit gamma [Polyangiaceae bacterium]